jgi:hypothetical protein
MIERNRHTLSTVIVRYSPGFQREVREREERNKKEKQPLAFLDLSSCLGREETKYVRNKVYASGYLAKVKCRQKTGERGKSFSGSNMTLPKLNNEIRCIYKKVVVKIQTKRKERCVSKGIGIPRENLPFKMFTNRRAMSIANFKYNSV